ncbi:MAG: ligand-binding sensor domain-containing protein, partial [Verrucomicrobiota bacterium]
MRHLAIFFKTALILGLFCATPQPARAAESKEIPAKIPNDYYVQTWQDDDGLPRNTLTAISQTPDGYLWLATSFGLIRFDGVRFATFGEEVLPELARSLIWQLQTDRAGRLWIGTGKGGILVFENGTFRRIKSDLPHSTVYSMCEDPSGVMWVSTGDGSISRIVNGKAVELIGPLRGNRSSMAIRLVRDRGGDLWFAQGTSYGRLVNGVATNVVKNSSGLVHLCASHSGGVWLSVNRQLRKIGLATDEPTFRLPFGNYEIQQLFEDRQGNLWIATRNLGLFRFSQNELQPVLPSKNRILDIFQDAEGSLWVATEGGGLSKIRPRVFRMLSSDEGVPPGKVLSVCEDRSGVLWVLPQFGGLAHSITNGNWEVLSGTTNVGLTSVLPDRNGGVWVGTVSAGLLHYDGQKVERMLSQTPFQDRQLRVLYPGREGQLWVALFPSGLTRLDGANITSPSYYRNLGLNEQAIWAMAEEKNGALWTGTINGNLQRLENEKVTSYTEADGLPGTAIGALHLDGAGQLWVGTLGSGLGSLRNGKFKFASVREGLHDNVISQIVEDDYGFVWFGSNRGIFRVRKLDLDRFMSGQQSKVESIAYGKSDGLANVECGGGYQP